MDPKELTAQLETSIDAKLEKNNEGLLTRFSEMISKISGKKKEEPVQNSENVISLSDAQAMNDALNAKFEKQMNELKLQLIAKDKSVVQLSEDVKKQKLASKAAQADAICKEAAMDGVPQYVINLFKPVLLSEQGDQTIKLSENVTKSNGDIEVIEAEKPINSIIQDLFKNFPNKVNMSEISKTFLSAPSADEDKLINDRAKELHTQGKSMHEALMLAGSEIRKR